MRTLVLNIGNTSLSGGIFTDGRLVARWSVPAREAATLTGFLRLVRPRLRGRIERVAIGSVVPELTPKIARLVARACGVKPRFLTATAPHGLAIGYRQPRELGVDRLAAALGARQLWPRRNVIFVDFGTATTVTALTAGGRIAGGAIFPGFGLWTEMLAARTAQLPAVEMGLPRRALGRDTRAGIASGVFFGHAGAVRELVARISGEAFGRGKFLVVGTGGNAARFRRENVFAQYEPNLILVGLHAFAHV